MKKTFRTSLCMACISMLISCEMFVTAIDEQSPIQATEEDIDLRTVLVAAQINYMGFLEAEAARLAGMWADYFNGFDRQYSSYQIYSVSAASSNTMWDNAYTWSLKAIRLAGKKAAAENNKSTLGMCQTMEASLMGTVAALWGDVPFEEAIDIERYPHPAYDPQTEVIVKCIVMLDSAIVNLGKNQGVRTGDFLIAAASNTNWIQVAQSAKARLQLYNKDFAGALVSANAGVQAPTSDLTAKHGTALLFDRNLYNDFQTRLRAGMMRANNTLLGRLLNATATGNRNHAKTNEASRLARYYTGTTVAAYTPNTSNTGYFAQSASFPLHTAFETKLIAAECYLRQGDFTNALTKLNEHRANLRAAYPTGTYTNFVASDFDPAGIENLAGLITANDALLNEILEEKYVCLYGQIEGFNEVRRTNNAVGIPPKAGIEIPQRFLYAQNEINANSSTPNPIPGLFEKVEIFK